MNEIPGVAIAIGPSVRVFEMDSRWIVVNVDLLGTLVAVNLNLRRALQFETEMEFTLVKEHRRMGRHMDRE